MEWIHDKEVLVHWVRFDLKEIWPAFFFVLIFEFGTGPSLYAHHGNAAYDIRNKVTVIGAVTSLPCIAPPPGMARRKVQCAAFPGTIANF